MNSFMSWVGGKKALRDEVIIRMHPFYEKYIEVFGGAGWVLFRKSPENEVEVFNDFNSNLVNFQAGGQGKEDVLHKINGKSSF